jgi:hypothetical protein
MEQSKINKVLAILLSILFVVSLTAVAASAHDVRGGHGFGMIAGAMASSTRTDTGGAVLGPHSGVSVGQHSGFVFIASHPVLK